MSTSHYNPVVANKRLVCAVCSHSWQPRVSLQVIDCPHCRCKALKYPPRIEEVTTQKCVICREQKPATVEFFSRHVLRLNGLHNVCKECSAKQRQKWEEKNPHRAKAIRQRWEDKQKRELGEEGFARVLKKRMSDSQSRLKTEMLVAYGQACACCGETEPAFLTLDHINGGGARHRRTIPGGNIYRILRKQGWPKEGYRILCMNCNFAIRFGSPCPHTRTHQT